MHRDFALRVYAADEGGGRVEEMKPLDVAVEVQRGCIIAGGSGGVLARRRCCTSRRRRGRSNGRGEEGREVEDVGEAVGIAGEEEGSFQAVEDGVFGAASAGVFFGEAQGGGVEVGDGVAEGGGLGG